MHHRFIKGSLCIIALTAFNKPMTEVTIPAAIQYAFVEGSRVTTRGATNIRPFDCICLYDEIFPGLRADLITNDDHSLAYFKNATLKIDVKALDCGNYGITSDLCHILKADKYPYISIKIRDAASLSNRPIDLSAWTDLKVDAAISIAGETRQATIMMRAKQIGDKLFDFTGKHILYMTDFDIKPPTALFGMIKVKNTVVIQFDLKVKINIIS